MSSQVDESLSFNLEQYFGRLTLQPIIHGPTAPPMPPPQKRSTLTPLTLRPAGYRRLREMHRFDLSKKIVNYFSKLEAGEEHDAFRSLQGLLEHDASFQGGDHEFSPYLINSVTNLENLLYRLFFLTQGILETMDTDMRDWSFQTVHRLRNNPSETQALDPILFCRPGPPLHKPTSVKLVILPLCPWEFAPQDFSEFSTIGRFDDTVSTEWQSRNWVNADKMWAHLYDVCLDFQCPFFAITSYEQWIFGGFSKHYTSAWFTPTLRFDNKPVSVIEILVFWIHASFTKKDTFTPPNLYSERQLTDAHLEEELQSHAKRYLIEGLTGNSSDFNTEDMPPAKRRRKNPPGQNVPSIPREKRERYRQPPRHWKKLRELTKKKRDNGKLSLGRTESVVSIAASYAPSSADPLPYDQIPRTKNSWCERWRNMVALGEDGTNRQLHLNEVTLQVYDPTTGIETGDFVHVQDFTCPSCYSPSPPLSDCSLSEEEIARLNPKAMEEDFLNFTTSHWGGEPSSF